MLEEPSCQVIRHTDVKHTRFAPKNVDEVVAHILMMKRQRFLDKLGMTGNTARTPHSVTLSLSKGLCRRVPPSLRGLAEGIPSVYT